MARPHLEVADIFAAHGDAYVAHGDVGVATTARLSRRGKVRGEGWRYS